MNTCFFAQTLRGASLLLVRRGGCATNRFREATAAGADGVVTCGNSFSEGPPRPLQQRRLRTIFLMSRPPLLVRRGLTLFQPRRVISGFAKLSLCIFLFAATACKSGPELARFYPVPDFSLTDQSDRNVKLDDLKGHVWVADFIFTNCAGACPMMTDKMRKLQDTLPVEVRMVSITVDPSRDTPKALAAYAAERGATPDRWLFLTGEKQALHDLCIKGFKLPLDETGGTAAEPIGHSTRFVLVDQQGEIRGYYDATDEESLKQLAGDAKSLL